MSDIILQQLVTNNYYNKYYNFAKTFCRLDKKFVTAPLLTLNFGFTRLQPASKI